MDQERQEFRQETELMKFNDFNLIAKKKKKNKKWLEDRGSQESKPEKQSKEINKSNASRQAGMW